MHIGLCSGFGLGSFFVLFGSVLLLLPTDSCITRRHLIALGSILLHCIFRFLFRRPGLVCQYLQLIGGDTGILKLLVDFLLLLENFVLLLKNFCLIFLGETFARSRCSLHTIMCRTQAIVSLPCTLQCLLCKICRLLKCCSQFHKALCRMHVRHGLSSSAN